MSQANACGTCRMCCNLLAVADLGKPANRMCEHACSSGCNIYASRPASCADYACIWLQTQATRKPLPLELRPDNCGVVLDTLVENPDSVIARLRPGQQDKLEARAVKTLIGLILQQAKYVIMVCGNKREVLTFDASELNDTFISNEDGVPHKLKVRLVRR